MYCSTSCEDGRPVPAQLPRSVLACRELPCEEREDADKRTDSELFARPTPPRCEADALPALLCKPVRLPKGEASQPATHHSYQSAVVLFSSREWKSGALHSAKHLEASLGSAQRHVSHRATPQLPV